MNFFTGTLIVVYGILMNIVFFESRKLDYKIFTSVVLAIFFPPLTVLELSINLVNKIMFLFHQLVSRVILILAGTDLEEYEGKIKKALFDEE